MKLQWRRLLILLVLVLSNALGQSNAPRIVISPEDLKWIDRPAVPGQRRANLVGDPTKAGPYIIRLRFPPNTPIAPHSHPDDRYVTVLAGTWYVGSGESMNREKAAP